MFGIKLLIYLFVSCQWIQTIRTQDEDLLEQEILRTSERQRRSNYGQVATVGYQTNVIHRDESNEDPSVSTVSFQMNMRDDKSSGEQIYEDYLAAKEEYDAHVRRYRERIQEPVPYGSSAIDTEVGASNEFGSVQYSLPPDGFAEQYRSQNYQFASTPGPMQYTATPAPPQQFQHDYQGHQYGPGPQVQYASTPAPQIQYATTPAPQVYTPSPQPPPQLQYDSTPQQIPQSSTPQRQYASPPPQNIYASSPAHQIHYESTPQPNYATTALPLYMSTPPPMEYGNRIHVAPNPPSNHIDQQQPLNQMQIDHYNHAVNGVRKPKEQYHLSIHVTTTPAPDVSSGSSDQSEPWRMTPNSAQEQYDHYHQNQNNHHNHQNQQNQPNHQNQQNQQNYQNQPNHLSNSLESSNNLVMNVVHPTPNEYQSRSNHVRGFTRDLEKESAQAMYSHGDYGWRMENNIKSSVGRSNGMIEDIQHAGSYSTPSPIFREPPPQAMFLNAVSSTVAPLVTPAPYHSDQNINVGYSIGFGQNEHRNILRNPQPVPQEPTPQPINQYRSDVVKGNIFQGPQLYTPDSLQTQDFVTAALKSHNRYKQSNAEAYGNYPQENRYNFNNLDNVYSTYAPNFANQNAFRNQPTPLPAIVTSFISSPDRNDGRHKWQNLSPNVEFGNSPNHHVDSVTRSPFSYSNGGNEFVTSAPFYPNQIKDYNEPKTITFDHAKALKNIQPIDLTNVVPYSNGVTVSPYLQNYPQPDLVNAQSYRNYYDRPFNDQVNQYYRDKNVDYTVQFRPKPIESQLPNYNLQAQATNTDSRRIPQISFIQSDTYKPRLQQQNTQQQNFQLQSPIPNHSMKMNHNLSPLRHFAYPANIDAIKSLPSLGPIINYEQSASNTQSVYDNNGRINQQRASDTQSVYDNNGRINQNLRSHNTDTAHSSHTNLFNSFNKNVDDLGSSVVTTINGIKVVNPFNVDLQVIADMLKGKTAIDETHMKNVREDIMRSSPVSLQDIIDKAEQKKMNERVIPDYTNADYRSLDSLSSIRSQQFMNELVAAGYVDIPTASPRPFYGYKYSRSHQEEASPLESVDQLPNAGTVMDQPQQQSAPIPSRIQPSEFTAFDSLEPNANLRQDSKDLHDATNEHPNALNPEETSVKPVAKKLKEPYPLLKPPRPPVSARQRIKKNEGRAKYARLAWGNRKLKHKHAQEDLDSIRIPTKLRPPQHTKRHSA